MLDPIADLIQRLITTAATPFDSEPLAGLIIISLALAVLGARSSQKAGMAAQERRVLTRQWYAENAETADGNGGDHYMAARVFGKENATIALTPVDRIVRIIGLVWIIGVLIWARSGHQAGEFLADAAWAAGPVGIALAIAAACLTVLLQFRGRGATDAPASPAVAFVPAVVLLVIALLIPIASTITWVVSVATTVAISAVVGRVSLPQAAA